MDGCGKGTQVLLLEEKFLHVLFVREPGGTAFAEELRTLVRDSVHASHLSALQQFLLFWAARADLLLWITKQIEQGHDVFSDRGDSATFAFQVCGEDRSELAELFWRTRGVCYTGRRAPDLYLILDLPAQVARERALADAGRQVNHFDAQPLVYYDRVRAGFRNFGEAISTPVEFVDATGTPEEVHAQVLTALATHGIKP
jgi:dTMP kinase